MEISDGKTLEGRAGKVSDWRKAGKTLQFVDYTVEVSVNKITERKGQKPGDEKLQVTSM